MSVPYTGTHARILDALAGHLAAGPAVQEFLGVAAAADPVAAARALIVEIDGAIINQRFILLEPPVVRHSRTPGGAYRGQAHCEIVLCSPQEAGDSAQESQRRALNWFSPIYEWTAALRYPLVRDIAGENPAEMDVSDGLPAWMVAGISLDVEVTL
jgi:hypothetical protein